MQNLRNLEKCILEKTLAGLRLDKARQEFVGNYVYGFDDVERSLTYQIEILNEVIKIQGDEVCLHCWLRAFGKGHRDHFGCCYCNVPRMEEKN